MNKALSVSNILLSVVLIATILYAFMFHHLLRRFMPSIFSPKLDVKVRVSTYMEILDVTWLLIFISGSLVFDLYPQFKNLTKYFGFMKLAAFRGLFHIWVATSIWNLFINSLPIKLGESPKDLVNCVSWISLTVGVVEIVAAPFVEPFGEIKLEAANMNTTSLTSVTDASNYRFIYSPPFFNRIKKELLKIFNPKMAKEIELLDANVMSGNPKLTKELNLDCRNEKILDDLISKYNMKNAPQDEHSRNNWSQYGTNSNRNNISTISTVMGYDNAGTDQSANVTMNMQFENVLGRLDGEDPEDKSQKGGANGQFDLFCETKRVDEFKKDKEGSDLSEFSEISAGRKNKNALLSTLTNQLAEDVIPEVTDENQCSDNSNDRPELQSMQDLPAQFDKNNTSCIVVENPVMDFSIRPSVRELTVHQSICDQSVHQVRYNKKHAFYLDILHSSNIDGIFDDVLQNHIRTPFSHAPKTKKFTKLIDEKYCKDSGLGYRVDLCEEKLGKMNMHHLYEEWAMTTPKEGPLEYHYFFNLLDIESRSVVDEQVASFEMLYFIEKGDTKYSFMRQTTKKMFMMKSKELLWVQVIKQVDENTWMEAYVSYDDMFYPLTPCTYDRMTVIRGGLLYEKVTEENISEFRNNSRFDKFGLKVGDTKCTKYTYLDPQTKMPMLVIKKPMASYFKNFYQNQFKVFDEVRTAGKDNWGQLLHEMEWMS